MVCCRACNEFLNGYRVTDPPPATVDEFFKLRDRHFLANQRLQFVRTPNDSLRHLYLFRAYQSGLRLRG